MQMRCTLLAYPSCIEAYDHYGEYSLLLRDFKLTIYAVRVEIHPKYATRAA